MGTHLSVRFTNVVNASFTMSGLFRVSKCHVGDLESRRRSHHPTEP